MALFGSLPVVLHGRGGVGHSQPPFLQENTGEVERRGYLTSPNELFGNPGPGRLVRRLPGQDQSVPEHSLQTACPRRSRIPSLSCRLVAHLSWAVTKNVGKQSLGLSRARLRGPARPTERSGIVRVTVPIVRQQLSWTITGPLKVVRSSDADEVQFGQERLRPGVRPAGRMVEPACRFAMAGTPAPCR
jgi:hypothetical protein